MAALERLRTGVTTTERFVFLPHRVGIKNEKELVFFSLFALFSLIPM